MSSERLAVERATWVVAAKTRLQPEFTYREHINDFSTTLVVKHDASPDWKIDVRFSCAQNVRNRVEIDGTVFSYSFSGAMRDKLVDFLNTHRLRYTETVTESKRYEAQARVWQDRQKVELKGIKEVGTVSTTIIRSGPYEGQYTIAFYPGHPLEHLTLEQTRIFHEFLKSLGSTKRENLYVEQAALEEPSLVALQPEGLARVSTDAAGSS